MPTSRLLGVPVPALKYFGPLLVMWVLSLFMLVFMKDFGMSLLFMATFIAMLYVATTRVAYVVAGAALFAVGAGGAYQYVAHVHERFAIWLDPWHTAATSGYQLLQSLFAIADGGLVGAGFGRGYLLYANHVPTVPELQTDFIFSAVANELGVAGGDRPHPALPALRVARLPHRPARRRRLLQAAGGRPGHRVRPAELHHHRRRHAPHPADRHHAAVRELRRQLAHRQPHARRAAAHGVAPQPWWSRRAARPSGCAWRSCRRGSRWTAPSTASSSSGRSS